MSGLLVVIGIVLFARALQKDPIVRGIKPGQNEIKSTQYADDTTVSVLVHYLESVPHLMKLLEDFKKVSSLEINTHKTEAMWLGCWRNRNDEPFGFKWPQDSVHALGVHFLYDPQLTDKLNFEEKIRTLEQTLRSWKRRKLTLLGKINIVKALA